MNKSPNHKTLIQYLEHWSDESPNDVWLRERHEGTLSEYTWAEARAQIHSLAAWIESRFPRGTSISLLSRNRAHWILADLAIIAAGCVTVPIFTTLPPASAKYIFDFSESRALILGEAENWTDIQAVLPEDSIVVTLPGVEIDYPHQQWNDILAQYNGSKPIYRCQPTDLISLVFTSGTTGVPKGVMQTHESFVIPIVRFELAFRSGHQPSLFSYLPFSHIAERQLVEGNSLVNKGVINFNESLPTILRDLRESRPVFFFGPPRIWEQLQQAIIVLFGSPEAVVKAFDEDPKATRKTVQEFLGLDQCSYCLAAAAPTHPALIKWFVGLSINMFEGFGQTEAMGLIANTVDESRVGSIGKPIGNVEIRLNENQELLVRADGLAPGYFKQPEKTAELYQDGWLHTGDKARVDSDGFVFLTGRVKEYFKTIHGKFVAPPQLEGLFAANGLTEQLCLLGRGFSKTVMVCVLADYATKKSREALASTLRAQAERVNEQVDKHARIGVVIISNEIWSIANEMLTPTLKIRRNQVEKRFDEWAQTLAHTAAETSQILIEWESDLV